ncbi:MAG: putative addiction module antidote protein [Sphingomonadaceae bacterium]|nr:putative addiction module antidote protein [Sphingomonadaceae bacterium]
MPLETTPFDVAEHLTSDERVAAYLEEAFDDGDPALIAAALGDVARARGMARLAEEAGISREALYRSLSDKGNPRLSTLLGVTRALGMKLAIVPDRKAA